MHRKGGISMEVDTFQQILFYIVLPLLGIGLIIFALGWGRRLCKLPVEIDLKKLGLCLKSDALTLLILLGCALACVGVFVWFRGYETTVKNLKSDLQKAETKINTQDNILERFRAYNMGFLLVFAEAETVDPQEIKVQAYIAKQGDTSAQLYDANAEVGLSDDIWVRIDNLNPGDRLRIVAYGAEGEEWESAEIVEIPKSRIQMRRITR
jgi:hypothetical protein